ncbi:electron transfer DM13 [Tamaricihabitans halophyticus]|uniref:Electron transfer DM13 n=1 Tax=Tamaricihabitans halophyticus TaxID=1262583 RepID=A0A4V2SV60_9PSEU|nr:DM13 domain-containing protein [Tamaricihabitans halophyticus]TCP57146.1 electron transfer DM13 [Tamaricihabitans halophyticus]
MPSKIVRSPWTWTITALVAVLLAGGLWAFQPWKAFTSSTVHEELPGAAPESTSSPGVTQSSGTAQPTNTPARPHELARGQFEDGEHATSGTARLLELPDGTRVLRLEGLATSDGPDVHVWLSDQESGGEWGSYDDGRYIPLGKMKATHGDQNYALPEGARIGDMRSAVLWCDRFNVAFGTASIAI